jgi:hypothetical protein
VYHEYFSILPPLYVDGNEEKWASRPLTDKEGVWINRKRISGKEDGQ